MEMFWITSFGEAFLRVYDQHAHLSQRTSHTLGISGDAKQGKHIHHRQHDGCEMFDVVPVHQPNNLQILGILAHEPVIEVAAVQVNQIAEAFATHACGAALLKLRYLTFRPTSS